MTDCRLIVEHQVSPFLARAFQEAGVTNLLQTRKEDGDIPRINNGKGEAMMLVVIIAKHMNYYIAKEQHVIVHIKWKSKPKVRDGELVFDEFGRSSRVVNNWMNRLLKVLGGDTTPDTMIGTSNAGEHPMSIGLALNLRFATGYAVEPFQLTDSWERFGVSKEPSSPVRILQIETCNRHIHNAKHDADHIERMQIQGFSTIYHSDLTPSWLEDKLCAYMKDKLAAFMSDIGEPEKPLIYNPLDSLDWNIFEKALLESETLRGNMPKVLVAAQM